MLIFLLWFGVGGRSCAHASTVDPSKPQTSKLTPSFAPPPPLKVMRALKGNLSKLNTFSAAGHQKHSRLNKEHLAHTRIEIPHVEAHNTSDMALGHFMGIGTYTHSTYTYVYMYTHI